MRSNKILLLLASLAFVAVGCASPSDDGADSQNGAISGPEAAAQTGKKTQLLVADFKASAESTRDLGVTSWSAYSIAGYLQSDYLLIFGVGADKQVRYGITVAKLNGEIQIATYNDKGPAKSATKPDANALLKISDDLKRLSPAIQKQAVSGQSCSGEVAKNGAIIVADAAAVVGSAVAGFFVFTATASLEIPTAGLFTFVGLPALAGLSYVAVVTSGDLRTRWNDMKQLCTN